MGVLAAVAGVAGAAIQGIGAMNAANAQSAAASYQAQVAANNAAIAKQNAEWEIQSGEVSADTAGRGARVAVGMTKAGQAASGVDVNSKSSTDVRAAEGELGMLDALTIRTNAARKAYGYEVAASSDTAQSQLLQMEAKNASAAGPISALGSFLGGISSVGSNYARYQAMTGGGGSNPVSTAPLSLNPADYQY